MTIDAGRREEITRKYMLASGPGFGVQDSPTPEQAAIIAEAEQHVQTMRDLRRACEEFNGPELAWLLWELPAELRARIDRARTRLREAQARDDRDQGGVHLVHYYDDRNKHDVASGWPEYEPNNPHHQTVPFGVLIWEPDTVHVLRGGTRERVTEVDLKSHQSPARERSDLGLSNMPDFGPAYDFDYFMARAKYLQMWRFCDMHMAGGCVDGIGGGTTRLIAIPTGQYVWVLNVCESCIDALARSHSDEHPNWREPEPPTFRMQPNIFREACARLWEDD